MATRVLIAGLLVHDSGKTWLGVSLAKKLVERGASVGVFKPVAGHSAWYQYKTVVESLRRGILLGEDIAVYADVLGGVDVEVSNPIDILLSPPDIEQYAGPKIYSYLADLDNLLRQAVLARVSRCSDRSTQHYVFRDNLSKTPPLLRKVLEELAQRLDAANRSIEEFFAMLKSSTIEEELARCLEVVERGKDVVVVESFNNAIAPFSRALRLVDIVLLVAPGAVAIYDDVGKIARLVEGAVRRYGDRGFDASNVVAMLKPRRVEHIEPRASIGEASASLDRIADEILAAKGRSD